jgi:hypothetical protein
MTPRGRAGHDVRLQSTGNTMKRRAELKKMARPRLVEEGVPIGSTLGIYGDREDDDDEDEEMMMELEDRHHVDKNNRVGHKNNTLSSALQRDEDEAARSCARWEAKSTSSQRDHDPLIEPSLEEGQLLVLKR